MRIGIALLLLLICQNVAAGPYFEFGGLYTNDRFWVQRDDVRDEESGIIGHVSIGYDFELSGPGEGAWLLDIQGRHESDPKNKDQHDLSARDSIGAAARYRFW
jgi:hypothetical protein